MKTKIASLKVDWHCITQLFLTQMGHQHYEEGVTTTYRVKIFGRIFPYFKWTIKTYIGCTCGKSFYGKKEKGYTT